MSYDCHVALPHDAKVCLQFVIVVFHDHTHLLFLTTLLGKGLEKVKITQKTHREFYLKLKPTVIYVKIKFRNHIDFALYILKKRRGLNHL